MVMVAALVEADSVAAREGNTITRAAMATMVAMAVMVAPTRSRTMAIDDRKSLCVRPF